MLGLKVLREHREPYAQGRFDVPGLLSGGVGVALVLYALSQAANDGWTSLNVVVAGLGGLALLAIFCLLEQRASPPVLDLGLFKRGLFTLGTTLTGLANASYTGFIFLLTLFLQHLQDRTPAQAGLIQGPSAVGSLVSLIFAARVYARVGPRRMMAVGFGTGGLLLLPVVLFDKSTAALPIVLVLTLRGFTTPYAFTASQTIVYGPLDSSKQGPASSLYNTSRQIAASFGVALLATVQVSRYHSHLSAALASAHLSEATKPMMDHAQELAFHDAFFVAAALMMLAGLLSCSVSDRKAREAMQRRVRTVERERPAHEPAPAVTD